MAETASGAPSAAQVLAEGLRGDVVEAVYRGHAALVDLGGRLIASAGDPGVITPLRSCAKPLQALPFVELALERLEASDAELALACASHNGEPEHVATARRLLARAGVDESKLVCGPQLPTDEASARRLLAAGGQPLPVHNNCSGKHAAMLATCAVEGWPLDGYEQRGHRLQQTVTATLERHLGVELHSAPWGVDGCGLPTFGVPLRALARAFAAASDDRHFQRCQDAMAAHPFLVAGTGRFDTALLTVAGERLTAKIGGAAVWVAVLRPAGPALAIKLEAGAGEAIPAIALAALEQVDALPDPLPPALAAFAEPVTRNWAGTAVGRIRPAPAPLVWSE